MTSVICNLLYPEDDMFKNWEKICAETNPFLRLVAAATTDEATLKGLELAFPQFFTTEEQGVPKMQASVLRARLDKKVPTEESMKKVFKETLERFGIPYLYLGKPNRDRNDWGEIGLIYDTSTGISALFPKECVDWEA